MCLAIPGRIVAIDDSDPTAPVATIDYGIATKTANLLYTPEARVGDFVIVQAGYATRRLEESEAREALESIRQVDEELAASARSVGASS